MKYLCLVYITENEIYSKPKGEFDSMVSEAMAYVEEIRRNGHCLAVERLHSVRAAASVRVRNGRVAVTDGPLPRPRNSWPALYSSKPGI